MRAVLIVASVVFSTEVQVQLLVVLLAREPVTDASAPSNALGSTMLFAGLVIA
jgi:hypothetical protein